MGLISMLLTYVGAGAITKVVRAKQHNDWYKLLSTITTFNHDNMTKSIDTVSTMEGAVWPVVWYKFATDKQFRVEDPSLWNDLQKSKVIELYNLSNRGDDWKTKYDIVRRLV